MFPLNQGLQKIILWSAYTQQHVKLDKTSSTTRGLHPRAFYAKELLIKMWLRHLNLRASYTLVDVIREKISARIFWWWKHYFRTTIWWNSFLKPAFLETAFIRLLSTFYFYHLVHFSLHSMHNFALSFYLFACFLFAFACNAKGFAIVTLVLFLLFLIFAVFGQTARSFF